MDSDPKDGMEEEEGGGGGCLCMLSLGRVGKMGQGPQLLALHPIPSPGNPCWYQTGATLCRES